MELASLVGEISIASAERAEILASAWFEVITQLENDAANRLAIYGNVHKTFDALFSIPFRRFRGIHRILNNHGFAHLRGVDGELVRDCGKGE